MFTWPTITFKCNCHTFEYINAFIRSTAFKGRSAWRITHKTCITSEQSLLQKATIPLTFHTFSIHVYNPWKWNVNFIYAHQDWLMGGLITHRQLLTATTGYSKRCVSVCPWSTLVPNTVSILYLLAVPGICESVFVLKDSKKVSNETDACSISCVIPD